MKLISDKDPIQVFKDASKILYDAVGHTLGPSGSNTAVVYGKDIQANPKFQIINDGKTIIDNLTSPDAEVACALQTIRESVLSTNTIAGDGTTSTIVMIYSLLNELSKLELSNFEICRQIKNLKRDILEAMPHVAQHPIGEKINIAEIAETSLGSPDYADLFVDAFDFAGKYGEVLLEKSNNPIPEVEKIDGISLNQIGIIPELVLDDAGDIKKTLGECQVVVLKGTITSFNMINNLMLKAKGETPIILFYDKMSSDVFRLMASNLVKGGYNFHPIALYGYGEETSRYMSLISKITCSDIIEASTSINYNDGKIYGRIDGIVFNKDAIILKPSVDHLEDIIKFIKENQYHISTKTAIVKAGANNSIALEEQYRRFEDAIHSCSNALKYGVCLGGGLTYIRMAQVMIDDDKVSKDMESPILYAFSSVYNTLLDNCSVKSDGSYRLPKLNEDTGEYVLDDDYYIYDSYKTDEQVIVNALDMLHSIFSTKVLICDPQR